MASRWAGVFLEDYIVWQSHQDVPTHDPWIMLAAMAMKTERLCLGTQVTPLARRRPWKLAREAVSTYDQGATFLGRRIGSTFEVQEYEPNCRVNASPTSGSFPISFTRLVGPKDGGSMETAVVEGDATGFFKLAEPLLRIMVQRSVDADYLNLKRILEGKL